MPSRHGVIHLNDAIPEECDTLAELLQARGVRTAGVISHFLLYPQYGDAQGFEAYLASGGRLTL